MALGAGIQSAAVLLVLWTIHSMVHETTVLPGSFLVINTFHFKLDVNTVSLCRILGHFVAGLGYG